MIGIVLQFITGGFTRALSWTTANAGRMLAIALAVAVMWAVVERNGRHKAERVLASTVAAWKAAEREATAAQLAANAAQQARWAQQAKETDDDYRKARIDADWRAERYIAANRVRRDCPRGAGGGDPVQGPASAPGIDGAGGTSELVTVNVPSDDIRICTRTTKRLEAAREWALGL